MGGEGVEGLSTVAAFLRLTFWGRADAERLLLFLAEDTAVACGDRPLWVPAEARLGRPGISEKIIRLG